MAQIDKPNEYFNTVLYTGNGSTQSISGVNFKPDWVWVKDRTSANSHGLFDVIRGATNALLSNSTSGTVTNANYLQSFDTDGFTLGSEGAFNTNTNNYASWNWLASNTTASNTSGSITSTVSANTTSGFSIVSYTGTGSVSTIGHGLGSTPACIIIKNRTDVTSWVVYHKILTGTSSLSLDNTNATNTGIGVFNNTDPTSSVFTVGIANGTNGSGDSMIAYCFAEKKGFSKFGSYTGNGSTDGTFVYTGFKPAFVIIKRTDTTASWQISDNKRDTFNVVNKGLFADGSFVESSSSSYYIDYLSNGFKLRNTAAWFNASGGTYIYMAFASEPLVGSNNVCATAR